jgi:hypothetical protein
MGINMFKTCALLPARRIPAGFHEVKRYTGEQRLGRLLNPIFNYYKGSG